MISASYAISERALRFISCKRACSLQNNGKRTRCYKIAKKDVAEYLYRRESDPMRYTPPSGWYYNYPKHKKPASSLERKLNYKAKNATGQGMVRATVSKLPGCTDRCASLRGDRLPTPHNSEMVQQGLAENHLADTQVYDSQGMAAGICASDFFNEISRKCGKHYAAIKEISSSRKAR